MHSEEEVLPVNPGEDTKSEETVLRFEGTSVRDRLVAALRFDLLGPERPDEVITQSPATRYLLGMLAPRGTQIDQSEDDSREGQAGDEADDAAPPMTMSLNPSSIGISFLVRKDVGPLEVVCSWGEYHKVERAAEEEAAESSSIEIEDDAAETVKRKKRKSYEWHRTPHQTTVELPVLGDGERAGRTVGEAVRVEWASRSLGDFIVVSVFLVNERFGPAGRRPPDEMWLYQPQLLVRGEGQPFLARSIEKDASDVDPDVASADLIYRSRNEFATGHGVSAAWEQSADSGRASEVWTEVIPEQVVPIVRPRAAAVGGGNLSMDALGALDSQSDLAGLLTPFLDDYEDWIVRQEEASSTIPAPHDQTASLHMKLARRCLGRMRAGVERLSSDESAFVAFKFANRAMALQRRHSVKVLKKRRDDEVPADEQIAVDWRPFQLGFILQCISGLADPSHHDREVADLLWFPTGGGKTEAYLGLSAFVLAHRRIRKNLGDRNQQAGTAVLMRYTLRLLTIQQFQRATALLCACEVLREADPKLWGSEPFRIGLWVGMSVTPNSFEDSKDALDTLKKGDQVYEASPYQVLFCPWCGDDLKPEHYVADEDLKRTLVKCPNEACEFSASNSREGLPVLLVDHEIYRHPPSLLLATVDKFAQMAWNGRIQSLFGKVERHCPRHGYMTAGESHPMRHAETRGWPAVVVEHCDQHLAPPDLIIQDELHLISGPLGTLVGIYETAVDALCRYEWAGTEVRPKVVASTATIRGATKQIGALFDRKPKDVHVFPPTGLDASDSFFAVEDRSLPGRLYLGIYAPGKSIKTALVRVYAAMLSRAKVEFDSIDPSDIKAREEADAYMTLVAYFNSLRELGGAVRLVDDDVPARLRVLRKRGFSDGRLIYEPKELTSRAKSSEISRVLKQLDRTFLEVERGAYPIDVLLASNMISVGVDIDRLGLMVVSAQPKTSAEYIQASSRVGRTHPGLVIEVYNWIRPRDTSHYERFMHYHDTFYRHVEATSVTPFSARARDRALPGVLVSLMRQSESSLSQEDGANSFSASSSTSERNIGLMVQRAESITEKSEVGRTTHLTLKNLAGQWEAATDDDDALIYTGRGLKAKDRKAKRILMKSMESSAHSGMWSVAQSLREVEDEIDIILLEDETGATSGD